MLAIRMTRMGAKKRPFYRIIVTPSTAKRDGRFVEIIGHHDPISSPKKTVVDHERYAYWLSKGAQPSDTVARVIRQAEREAASAATAAA